MASEDKKLPDRCVLGRLIEEFSGRAAASDRARGLLWKTVWEYMSPIPQTSTTKTCCHGRRTGMNSLDSPWELTSCAFTGCPETMCYFMHTIIQRNVKASVDATPLATTPLRALQLKSGSVVSQWPSGTEELSPHTVTHLVNQRTTCDFPLPDTWVNQCVLLALNPLHLACWRLDLRMIQTLLRLGADPNALALEQCSDADVPSSFDVKTTMTAESGNVEEQEALLVDNDHADSKEFAGTEDRNSGDTTGESLDETRVITVDGKFFYTDFGLSPLDFVVLGLRCPPTYSMEQASRHGVMHNTHDTVFRTMKCNEISRSSMCSHSLTDCVICQSFQSNDAEDKYVNDSSNYGEHTEIRIKGELLIKCLELLISVGANPNQGKAKCLEFWYPLDVLIQPPINIYYGPMMGRSSQIAVNIRRNNLEYNISQVTAGCGAMISHNARLSSSFMHLLKWKPKFIDCFAISSSKDSNELIKTITQLGLFPENLLATLSDPIPSSQTSSHNVLSLDKNNAKENHNLSRCICGFIADTINNEIPDEFVLTVLHYVSIPTIHLFCKMATGILETSEFEQRHLSDLLHKVVKVQMRSLQHSSMVIILASICSRQRQSFEALPIPNALKRRLLFADV